MATSIADNPFDTQPPKASGGGLVVGAMQQDLPTSGGLPGNVGASAPVTPNVATYAPTTREIDKPTGTVQGQVESILAKDSPLMQRARTLATQQMAQRGLVNSSMAAGAGTAAMIDRATPIAQQDANAYNQASQDNMSAYNTSGQFNAGELNRFGLQKGEQQFAADQSRIGREFQTSERLGSQKFSGEFEVAKQNFTAAQSALDRAQQTALADKSVEAQQALQLAQQKFTEAQSALDRTQQSALQANQQQFTAGQSALDRNQQTSIIERQATIQKELATQQQNFSAAQSALDRAQQAYLTDKSAANQMALQKAQQDFGAQQSALDRSQQAYLQNNQQAHQMALTGVQQSFTAAQSNLDRQQQAFLQDDAQKFQQSMQNTNIPANFALQISSSTMQSINSIASDANLSGTVDNQQPDGSSPKSRAISSALNYANSQISWANKFYSTNIPGLPTQ
jgi:hypothetical protein